LLSHRFDAARQAEAVEGAAAERQQELLRADAAPRREHHQSVHLECVKKNGAKRKHNQMRSLKESTQV